MSESFTAQETARRVDEAIASIRLPLENLEFTLEDYLLQNGCRLDTETRVLLACVRDCVARIAVSTRRLETKRTAPGTSAEGRDARVA